MKFSLVALMFAPIFAHAQTLTGASWFASTPTGGTSVNQGYADGFTNTVGGDQWFDLWLARNPDATSPINGPSDEQAGISIPLLAGSVHTYYLFTVGPCCNLGFSGFNLFFDGNSSNPGISVFAPNDSFTFTPDTSEMLSLGGVPVVGAGSTFYSSAGTTVVLSEFNWQPTADPAIDVCQAFAFTPMAGNVPSAVGSFTIRVFSSAVLSLAESKGAPFTKLTMSGAGFDPDETVYLYAGRIADKAVFATTTTDVTGSFAISAIEPQRSYGPMDVFAVGSKSQRLGASRFFVTPTLSMKPAVGAPGGTTLARELGFGAGETVNIYWNNPRQLVGTAVADSRGSAAVEIAIPADALLGIDELIGIGQTTQAIGGGAVIVK
jgi:hypothetical protein